uniref:Uncharacterized protein n=1 Tax=Noccaea caerulescens TaxID=107243 RepID=A0A1J3GNB3_NOCCA
MEPTIMLRLQVLPLSPPTLSSSPPQWSVPYLSSFETCFHSSSDRFYLEFLFLFFVISCLSSFLLSSQRL